MPELLQPSFAAGELSPQSQGRVDLAKYRVGCKTMRNMLVMPQGGAWNRAGTAFVATVATPAMRSRLIAFQFSITQQYCLEFGQNVMRVVKDAGLVEASPGVIYVLATPYAAADLPLLKFTQSADTMTLAHPAYPAQQLTRTADNAWSIGRVPFGASIAAPTGLTVTAVGYNASNGSFGFTYVVSAINGDTGEESLPSSSVPVTNNQLSSIVTNSLTWNAVAGAGSYNVYKVLGGAFGFIGTATSNSFDDANILPDTAIGIQQPRTAIDGQFPGVVEYHQQRLVFGASIQQPEALWMSQSADPLNFNASIPTVDSDAIKVVLATRQVNEIRNLVSLNALLVLTSGAEFLCEGNQNGILTPSATSMRQQSAIGCSDRPALLCGSDVLYEASRGTSVRNIRYDFNSNTYQSVDLSLLSSHLLVGYTIAEWCYVQEPDRLVWIVRNDGALLSLTYMRDQDVYAWCRHDTPGGVFESCCAITEGNADVAYFIVNRLGTRCIERMATRTIANNFLDAVIPYVGGATNSISGLTYLNGYTVTVLSGDLAFSNLPVAGGTVRLPQSVTAAQVGVPYVSQLETVSMETPYFDTAQGHMKKIPRVTLRLQATVLANVSAGPDANDLRPLAGQDDIPAFGPAFTGDIKVNLDADWGRQSSVFVQNAGPGPITILDVMPEIELAITPQQAPPPIPPLMHPPPGLRPPPKIEVPDDMGRQFAPRPGPPPPPKIEVPDDLGHEFAPRPQPRKPGPPRIDGAALAGMFRPKGR